MEIRDWFIFILTFFVGIVAGAYLYAVVFAPEYEHKDPFVADDANREIESLDIIGFLYGGKTPAEYESPSFRVNQTGAYRYTPGGVGEQTEEEGMLPGVLVRELMTVVESADLNAMSVAVSDKNCVSYVDGIEYAYSIEIKDDAYELDTCETAFENSSELGQTLMKLWRYMDDPSVETISISNTTETAVDTGEIDVEEKKSKWIRMLNPIKYLEDGLQDSFGTGE